MTNKGVLTLCFIALIAGVIGVMQWGSAQRAQSAATTADAIAVPATQPAEETSSSAAAVAPDTPREDPAEPVVLAMDPAPESAEPQVIEETAKASPLTAQKSEIANSVALLTEPLAPLPETSPLLSVPNPDGEGRTNLAVLDSPVSTPATEPGAPVAPSDDAPAPAFDIVRVERDGAALVAGRAAPGSVVTVTVDGAPTVSTKAGRAGDFVTRFRSPQTGVPQSIQLSAEDARGGVALSRDTIVVLVERPAETAPGAAPAPEVEPTIVRSTERGVEIVSAPDRGLREQISLDTISYSAVGAVVLSGRGQPGNTARIYANALRVADVTISDDGTWRVEISDIDAGLYILRVDEVDTVGDVTSRFESPFQREFPELVAAQQEDAAQQNRLAQARPVSDASLQAPTLGTPGALPSRKGSIVVQPGNNLWTIAEQRYGEGLRYTQIFRANADQIRDPNLIYPGQVFTLPQGTD
ncbi:MAG: LysM peptidoglycan-binding domain-containing protein [Pseudomonadota bacterium]